LTGRRATPAPDLDALLERDVFAMAEGLLGCRLRTDLGGSVTEVILTEVEAYAGAEDPASHAYRGRTVRNASMFGPAGTLYVYRSYGLHWCMNVVAGPSGLPHAVLLRGGIPTVGRDVMESRRGRRDHLADGPGKLSQALGIDGSADGTSVLDGPVRVVADTMSGTISRTPRVGVGAAVEVPWRYVLEPDTA
jgi:DNA-3-methyladenine glycosylase